jgi:acyl-CoA dehydrogenase
MTQLTSILADTADRIFQKSEPWPAGGFDAPLWEATEQSGLDRLLLPETMGGGGDAFPDAVAVAMASGKRAASIPLIETMVANWCLARVGLHVPEGPKALLVACGQSAPSVDRSGNVCWNACAELTWASAVPATVILATRDDSLCVARFDGAMTGTRRDTIAGEPMTLLDGAGTPIAADEIATWTNDEDEPLALLALLKAAAIVGASDTLVAQAIEYANIRVQFGRPIAKFQMIQQMIARMASETAAAAAAVQHAAREFGSANGVFAAAIAKGRASEAVGLIAATAHHVHGAIGFTAEHSLHRYSRRLWTWREEAGNEAFWYKRLGSAALREGGSSLWPRLVSCLRL